MSWREQFDARLYKMPTVSALVGVGRLVDLSWGNDTSPSFALPSVGEFGPRLLVETIDPDRREGSASLYTVTGGYTIDDPLLCTDSLDEAMAMLRAASALVLIIAEGGESGGKAERALDALWAPS